MNYSLKRRKRGIKPIRVLPLGYLTIIALGTALLTLPQASTGAPLGFFDALFTAVSASCVTGLIVVDTGTAFSAFGQAVILLLIQLGGLGFMTLATLLFSMGKRKISLKNRMTAAESLGEDTLSDMGSICARAARYTLVCEGAGAALLYIRFASDFGPVKGIWYAVFHSVSAFCNAGFDILGNYTSFVPYYNDPLVCGVIMALIVAGGLGFAVIGELLHKRGPAGLSLHARVALASTLALLLSGLALTLALEWGNPKTLGPMDVGEKLLGALFQSVTLRTAGINTFDQAGMLDVSKLISSVFMFIGGAPAGTAGGVKVTTIAVLILTVRAFLTNNADVNVAGRSLSQGVVRKALSLFFVALGTLLVSTAAMSLLCGGFSFIDCLYECASALGTVGLTCGVTAGAGTAARAVLCALMFAGRAGILTLALAIGGGVEHAPVRYPEGGVMIG